MEDQNGSTKSRGMYKSAVALRAACVIIFLLGTRQADGMMGGQLRNRQGMEDGG